MVEKKLSREGALSGESVFAAVIVGSPRRCRPVRRPPRPTAVPDCISSARVRQSGPPKRICAHFPCPVPRMCGSRPRTRSWSGSGPCVGWGRSILSLVPACCLHLGGSSGPCSPRSVAPGTRRRFSFAAARSEPASAVCIAPGRPDRTANERGAPSSRALVTQSCFPCCSQSSGATRSRSRALHEQCRCSSAVSAAVPPCTARADVLQLPSRPCRPFNTAHKFPILRSHCSAKRVPSCPQSESTRSYFTSTFADGNITVPSHLHQQPVGTIEVLQVSKAVNSRLRHVTSVQAVA